jgi:predicted nucleotidyltransferase
VAGSSELFESRRTFSSKRLADLTERLSGLPEVERLPKLCIYGTGSFARCEASEFSDIDIFFVHKDSRIAPVSRLDELKLFASVIKAAEDLGFPTFSNDGEFLRILYRDDMREMLGGRADDYENYFTARMLLLLESTPIVNKAEYAIMVDEMVDAYFRDYPDHAADFLPLFLINDILRFWKTLCLNYEHRRNKPDNDVGQKRKQQVKNFKLKFSRLMSCFGTIIAVCSKSTPINKEQIITLVSKTPLDRFRSAAEGVEELRDITQGIIDDYAWFLEQTAMPADELAKNFDSDETRTVMFARAAGFGEKMFTVLDYFAKKNNYSRYLVM